MSRWFIELDHLAVDHDGDVFELQEIDEDGNTEWVPIGDIDDHVLRPESEELVDLWNDSQWDERGQVTHDFFAGKGL